jgi:hypothetical protein
MGPERIRNASQEADYAATRSPPSQARVWNPGMAPGAR